MSEADEKLSDAVERVNKVTQRLHYNDPLRKYVDIIIKKFPEEVQAEFNKGHDDYEDYRETSGEDSLCKSSLEKLLKQSMKAVRMSRSTHIQWEILTDQCLDLEDVEQNRHSNSRFFKSSLRPSPTTFLQRHLPYLEWHWKVWLRSWVYRAVAVCLVFLSVTIVWSEVTFSIDPPNHDIHLSFFAFLVYAGHKFQNYITVEILSVGVVAYLSLCAYFTAFRIRIFNLYNLAPRHSTDEYSLLFSAVLLSRLALPVCLNYLYMIQVVRLVHHDNEDKVPQTAFAYATGNTSLVPWLTSYFYIYYPALILLVCIATLLSCGTRLASVFGYQKFIGEDDFSADYIDEGKVLMKRERRLRERSLREEGNTGSQRRRLNSFEQLKLSRAVRYSHQRRERAPVSEESRLQKLTTQVKGLATRGKEKVSAKYSKRDDTVELLNRSSATSSDSTSVGGQRSLRSYQPRRGDPPPSNLFNDI
ncbi:G-protein coupled receptor-associated protein LMBRD2 [Geodia barretti]|uniref:G-protein coupled receptor-associated protein LMBRD2 n=1 Tax=Geodia barretti TaxID=519541 RepID=A0AA35TC71_GEOBA|nr:G-protein coupled receptor-associated protein LMBRD2 [Geodia barretti]